MPGNNIRLAIRGFTKGVRQFEDLLDADPDLLDEIMPALALHHGAAMAAGEMDMIEFEFLDESDVDKRFFRVGTEPSGMVMPLRINLGGSDVN